MASIHISIPSSNDMFTGDVVDRYQDTKSSSVSERLGIRLSPEGAVPWEEWDAELSKSIKEGESTFAGWLNGVETKFEAARMFINNGDLASAITIDNGIRKVLSANPDLLLSYRNQSGVQPGSLAERMKSIATNLSNGAYDQQKVVFNGKEYTYGLLMHSPEGKQAVEQNVSGRLSQLGYTDPNVTKLLFGNTLDLLNTETNLGTFRRIKANLGVLSTEANEVDPNSRYAKCSDATARDCMQFLTENDLTTTNVNRGVMVNDGGRAVRAGMANELSANWAEYFNTFGTGTTSFINRAYNTFRESGGHRMMPGLRDYATSVMEKTGFTGQRLVDEVFRQYDDWKTAVTKTARPLVPGQPVDPDDVGLNEQNAALSGVLSAMTWKYKDFDLTNPEYRNNASRLGDMIAKLKSMGVNVMGQARRNGVDINEDMADHILGDRTPGSAIANLEAFFTDSKRFTGGVDFASALYESTHSAKDYWGNINRQNGGSSTCEGADTLLAGINRARAQTIIPEMFSRGLTPRDAIKSIRYDGEKAAAYAKRLADTFAGSLSGVGARDAAVGLTRWMLRHESDMDSGAINMQQLMMDAAAGKLKGASFSRDAQQSLRGWVDANITDAQLFAPRIEVLRNKLKSFGVDPYRIGALTSQIAADASYMKRTGRDWDMPFKAFDYLTELPSPVYDEGGKFLYNEMVLGNGNNGAPDGSRGIKLRGYKDPIPFDKGMYARNPAFYEALFALARRQTQDAKSIINAARRQMAKEDPEKFSDMP